MRGAVKRGCIAAGGDPLDKNTASGAIIKTEAMARSGSSRRSVRTKLQSDGSRVRADEEGILVPPKVFPKGIHGKSDRPRGDLRACCCTVLT